MKQSEERKNLVELFERHAKLFTKYYDQIVDVKRNGEDRKAPLNMLILELVVEGSRESKDAILDFIEKNDSDKYKRGSAFNFICRLIETDNFFFGGRHLNELIKYAAICSNNEKLEDLSKKVTKEIEKIKQEQNTPINIHK